jgi:hypothetical protein
MLTLTVSLFLLSLTPPAVVPAQAEPIPTVSTHFLQFGEVPLGEARVLPIELGNAGDEPWMITGLEFLGGQRFDFDCVQGLAGFVVMPGEIVVRDIVFTPGGLGTRAGYFHPITEFGHPSLLSQVTGRGVAAAGIGDGQVPGANGLRLGPPTPNPAFGRLGVQVEGARPGPATLTIHDIAGRRIRTFALRLGTTGRERIDWDGRTETGEAAPAGVYLLRLESGAEVQVRTAVLLH